MKVRALIATVLLVHSSLALSSEEWGPELIAFELEGGSKSQTMLWLSGFSYSSTELLRSARCLKSGEHIGSKELIVTLNEAFGGERINSEAATRVLGKYIRSKYVCVAYNQPVQPTADAAAD